MRIFVLVKDFFFVRKCFFFMFCLVVKSMFKRKHDPDKACNKITNDITDVTYAGNLL